MLASEADPGPGPESTGHIATASGAGETGLNFGGAGAGEGFQNRQTVRGGHVTGEQFGLVETATPLFAPVQRDGYNCVEFLVCRDYTVQVFAQIVGEGLHAGILVEMNEAAERAFVVSETGGVIKAPQTGTTGCADAANIKGKGVDKGRVAHGAEIFGFERGRGVETGIADRDAGPAGELGVADAAIIREESRKKTVWERLGALPKLAAQRGRGSYFRYRATREGAPP